MHPWISESLVRERLRERYEEAERERLAGRAPGRGRRRLRAALGSRLVGIGMRLAGPEIRPALVRHQQE